MPVTMIHNLELVHCICNTYRPCEGQLTDLALSERAHHMLSSLALLSTPITSVAQMERRPVSKRLSHADQMVRLPFLGTWDTPVTDTALSQLRKEVECY